MTAPAAVPYPYATTSTGANVVASEACSSSKPSALFVGATAANEVVKFASVGKLAPLTGPPRSAVDVKPRGSSIPPNVLMTAKTLPAESFVTGPELACHESSDAATAHGPVGTI